MAVNVLIIHISNLQLNQYMLQFQLLFIIDEAWSAFKMLKMLKQSLINYGGFVCRPPKSGVVGQHVLIV